MKKYIGVIIEESLEDVSLLRDVKILSTRISPVKKKHQTPWLSNWTLHTVEVERGEVEKIAENISRNLDSAHAHSWYADFDDGTEHYIIFPGRIFRIDMRDQAQYDEAKAYGVSIGIPAHQVDFRAK
ncbi:MAG: hypothetical protein A2849_00445 [Candidatus Taylorbacteria bacterium RIFCSPHIGHO2_01_FULL_51_15]|uniref:Uncharacterized protein n=1 Tax=Candidatus Taylorbacteria bacterium RIFCSPHIGHO2_01_FULL_51_15 TaxID=1802304 RepID=A0A1G2MBQ6_9BACT|nr:MAG: hypothetical protein A2849_00445 [Candidatus Taylorbacteria bacterium RIFCSPHIGHO2_01_FULL_51_15]